MTMQLKWPWQKQRILKEMKKQKLIKILKKLKNTDLQVMNYSKMESTQLLSKSMKKAWKETQLVLVFTLTDVLLTLNLWSQPLHSRMPINAWSLIQSSSKPTLEKEPVTTWWKNITKLWNPSKTVWKSTQQVKTAKRVKTEPWWPYNRPLELVVQETRRDSNMLWLIQRYRVSWGTHSSNKYWKI